jgi:hypothetical protein
MDKVWLVIDTSQVAAKIDEYIEQGDFASANQLHSNIMSYGEHIKSLIISKMYGDGKLIVQTDVKTVALLSPTQIKNLPILESIIDQNHGDAGVGIGLTLQEAVMAAKKSLTTGQIELYDSQEEVFKAEYLNKANLYDGLKLSPNVFDPKIPTPPDPPTPKNREYDREAIVPSIQDALNAEQQMIQILAEQISGGGLQQQNTPNIPPQLLQALQTQQQPEAQPAEAQNSQEEEKQSDEGSKSHEKLANLLALVDEKMPKFLEMANSNPEAFKKLMNLIHKLLDFAKEKNIQKIEIKNYAEELNKRLKSLPVGSVRGRRIKVIVNGRPVWRSVASGMILDSQGQPISVRSSNAKVGKKDETVS